MAFNPVPPANFMQKNEDVSEGIDSWMRLTLRTL